MGERTFLVAGWASSTYAANRTITGMLTPTGNVVGPFALMVNTAFHANPNLSKTLLIFFFGFVGNTAR
jgi:hypothetical protein